MVSRLRSGGNSSDQTLSGLDLEHRYQRPDAELIEEAFTRVTNLEPVSDEESDLIKRALTAARLLSDLEAHPACVVVALLRAHPWPRLEALLKSGHLDPDLQLMARDLHRMDEVVVSVQLQKPRGKDAGERLEAIRKLLLTLVQDIRVVIVALAERVWLMRNMAGKDVEEQQLASRQTFDLYAPLANRLGVWFLKWELEDLAFRIIEPDTYKRVAARLEEKFSDRERYIESLIALIRRHLQDAGLTAEVQGRPKHIYSIVKKMRNKNLVFEDLYDIRAVRVIVDEVRDCYTVLGIVHNLWTPVAGEFDDYIARPKSNHYRSLHTAVIGPEGRAIEVQIRTHEMHRDSELGIASHWRYKEGSRSDRLFEERVAWLRQMLEWQKEVSAEIPALPRLEAETLYVFTPQGRIIDLPRGSTAVDFAYHVHTDLGHRCRGAKVDGVIVPLNHPLASGQRVEIITVRQGGPSRDWLNPEYGYLHSHRALTKVRQWFKQQHLEQDLAQGRVVIDKLVHRLGKGQPNLEKLAVQCGYSRVDDFLIGLARGELSSHQVAALIDPPPPEPAVPATPSPIRASETAGVQVSGLNDVATLIARCCKPVPPEPIVGFVTRGRGISIHRANCRSLAALTEQQWQRLIPVSWGTSPHGPFMTDVAVDALDRQGLLRDISEILTREKVNVTAVNTQSRGDHARMRFTLQINSLEQLARALKGLNGVAGVETAYRL